MTTYGYYSAKQFENIKHHNDRPYIYWKNTNGMIVQVTEVTDGNYHNNFNDVIKLGPLEKWYKSSSEYIYINK
jgi:hypothetical protein